MIRFLTFAFIILALLFCKTTKAESSIYSFATKKVKVAFPFKVFNNILLVDVKINQTKTLKFIFDSGCKSTIIIHPKWLDSFDIPYKQKVYFSGLGNKDSIETMKINNGFLEVGNLKGEHVPIFILSKDTLIIDRYLGTDVDGIFGAELFEKYFVHIDYKKGLIELFDEKPKKIHSDFKKMSVEIRKSKAYLNCMVMNNKNELFLSEFLIDTGANIPVIIKNRAPEEVNIDNYINAEIGEGLSGPMTSQVCRIKKIFFDTIQFSNVITAFNETPITFKDINENTLDGNIGNDILSRMNIYYCYPEKSIYYKPTDKIYKPFEFTVSNIILLENKTKNGGFVVKSIASKSAPYLAGLQKGDEILKIDNQKCEDLKIEDALYLLNKRIGKKINLQFKRNDIKQKITYQIISII
ncbi:MAG: aspartyl protease family protein [Chitinophagales bacterium]